MMTDLIKNVREWALRLGNGIIDLASLATVMIDEVYRLFEALAVLASRYGWALTPSIDVPVILVLAAAARDSKAPHHAIYRLVCEHLRDNDWFHLHRIVEEMRDYSIVTPRRFKIVRDCVGTMSRHGERGYNAANLVVPTLFAQIDGMLTEFATEVGIDRWASNKNKRALRSEFERVTYRFDQPALELLFDVLFAPAKPGVEQDRRKLNRHKILHGEWLAYGRVEHVLRTLLIVDFVGYVVEEHRQRSAAHDWDDPVTAKSQISKMLSENFVAGAAEIARRRLMDRASILPQFALPSVSPFHHSEGAGTTENGLYLPG